MNTAYSKKPTNSRSIHYPNKEVQMKIYKVTHAAVAAVEASEGVAAVEAKSASTSFQANKELANKAAKGGGSVEVTELKVSKPGILAYLNQHAA